MPRLSTSNRVKDRITHLVSRLLAYANHELETEQTPTQITIRWSDRQSQQPKLLVQTRLKDLVDLIAVDSTIPYTKEQIRQDLRVLKDILCILEDNRTRTQGAQTWHFTLKLWHSSTAKNLEALENHWQQCTTPKSGLVAHSLPTPVLPSRPEQSELFIPFALKGHLPTSETLPVHSLPAHNLPARSYTDFVGRVTQALQLLKLLHPDHTATRIEITGIGGVGKTSLILEIAYCCLNPDRAIAWSDLTLEIPRFDVIIFTSAKSQQLSTRWILPQPRQEHTLSQICQTILRTIGELSWLDRDLNEQISRIQANFAHRSVLLIVDNLETIEEEQAVLAFLYGLPETVKVVVTSCKRAVLDPSIHLEALPEAEGLRFIQSQAQSKVVALALAEAHSLYEATGGIPAAIVYAIGQVAQGYLLPDALPRLTLAQGDYCRFYFERSIQSLIGHPAHRLLMGLALFPKPVPRDTMVQMLLSKADAVEGLAQLHQLSLVTLQADRYTMLPLTQNYALAELRQNPEFEQEIRERWIDWYLEFCQQHGHRNWKEWRDYTALDGEWENVQAAIEWCIDQNRYEDFSRFWQYVKGYTHLYGYQSDRLSWIPWWIQAAEARSDHITLAQALRDHAWTLTLMGKANYLAQAEQLLHQAWEKRDPTDLQFQFELSLEQGILCIHQSQFAAAQAWLQQAKNGLPQVQLEATDRMRYEIRIAYYEAEVWYRRGSLEQAKQLFDQVLATANQIGWQQVEIYTLNWLAEIALAQIDLDQAEALLNQSLPVVQQQQDKRSIAFHARSQAYLEHLRGNERAAQRWFKAAIESFTSLGMDTEVQELQSRLEEIAR